MHPTSRRFHHRSWLRLCAAAGSLVTALGCGVDDRSAGVIMSGPPPSPGAGDDRSMPNDPSPTLGEPSGDGSNGDTGSPGAGGSSSVGGSGAGGGSEAPPPALPNASGGSGGTGPSAPAAPAVPAPQPAPEPPVSLSVTVAGSGRVSSEPAGIDCPGVCSASFPQGSSVRLTDVRLDASGQFFAGWQGACNGLDDCSISLNAAASVSASFGPANIAFVTSTSFMVAELGGVAGADAQCQQHAARGGLNGIYRAWLATDTALAENRFAGVRGWVRPDGRAVADTPQALASAHLFYPIRLDEDGSDVGANLVATGAPRPGQAVLTCSDWTDPAGNFGYGSTTSVGSGFQINGSNTCSVQPAALYCLGVDRQARVLPDSVSGRTAFVSTGQFTPGAGIAPADALCQSEATAAGLTGSFLAELATSSAPPESRFDLTGPPWVRPDGVLLAQTARAYFADDLSLSAPTVDARGEFITNARNWLGLPNDRTVSADATCQNWTSSEGSTGFISTVDSTEHPGSALRGSDCTFAAAVICLQE